MNVDSLIVGGRIIDGTGNPWFYADVAITADRISCVAPPGRLDSAAASVVIDASGMVVCPGFIDILSQSIVPFLVDGRALSKITQGVTTEIMGEGWTPAPFGGRMAAPFRDASFAGADEWAARARSWTHFGAWLEDLEQHGVAVNVGSFIGGATLREWGKGLSMGPADRDELEVMRHVTADAMEDGALGVATALIYPPGAFAQTDELVEIATVVGRYGGVYASHIRSQSNHLLEGIDEAIEIGRRATVAVEIYHLKAIAPRNWSKMARVIERIDAARAAGVDVTADMYPYIAGGTGLTACLPPWASADGHLFQNLRNPEMRARIRAEVLNPSGDWEDYVNPIGPEQVVPIGFRRPEHEHFIGTRLSEIARARDQHWVDALLDLLQSEEQPIATIYFTMHEENTELQMRQPWMKFGTDAPALDPAEARGPTHPRAYGTYPRVLSHYVRDKKILPLEDAIRKMSSAVADRLGLRERGLLRAGYFADIVVLDPDQIADLATFAEPHQLSVGVHDVWVNGTRVLACGEHTNNRPGRFLRGPGAR